MGAFGKRIALPCLTAAAIAATALGATAAAAGAQLPGAPCGAGGIQCGTLDVPLDRSGSLAGGVRLAYERLPAEGTPTEAVFALAGGPGQAALPLASTFAKVLAPLRAGRDLVTYDQRGTGSSGALSCPPLTLSSVAQCASRIGPARGSYRSIDSAHDIEALRAAGGYERIALFGVSYGTKVALTYAALYPHRVSALVLDSLVAVDGPDPFARRAFRAARRIVRDLCDERACANATPSVTNDLRRVVTRLARQRLRGSVVAPSGQRVRVSLDAPALWAVVLAGDLNPALRAELPGALRAMLRGDSPPLLRLAARAAGLSGATARSRAAETPVSDASALQAEDDGVNDALLTATRCEETPFPWDRAADTSTRIRQASAAAAAIPKSAFAPFDRDAAIVNGLFGACARWPVASPPPKALGPLPNVPTLALAGQDDVRTSVEQARAAVSKIAGARVVVVRHAGHSVIGSDLGDCAQRELQAFASGTTGNCRPATNRFKPTPAPPRSLSAVPGRTRARRTVSAVVATIADVRRQLIGDAIASQVPVRSGARTGGLRGGVAVVSGSTVSLRSVTYVPGVSVSGTYQLRTGSARVRVSGSSAARGTLMISSKDRATGRLDGRSIKVRAGAAARPQRWSQPRFPHRALR